LKRKFEVVAARALHDILNVRTVCDVMITCISRGTFAALAAVIFLLALDYTYTAVGNTFISRSCRVWRFVELRNVQMPCEVLKISWSWYSRALYWLVSMWCHETIIPMAFVM